jgi:hypothetical protein
VAKLQQSLRTALQKAERCIERTPCHAVTDVSLSQPPR